MTANLYYTSPEHKQRWLSIMQELGRVYGGKLNEEYGAALYILTSSTATWEKARSYVDDEGIDFSALLAEVDFSAAYQVLLFWAWNLFNGGKHIGPVELQRLDEGNFTVALNALLIRRRPLPISELASEAELYNLEMDRRNRISAENRPKPWLPLQPGEEL